jgi:hypothetical protein
MALRDAYVTGPSVHLTNHLVMLPRGNTESGVCLRHAEVCKTRHEES